MAGEDFGIPVAIMRFINTRCGNNHEIVAEFVFPTPSLFKFSSPFYISRKLTFRDIGNNEFLLREPYGGGQQEQGDVDFMFHLIV